MIGNSSVELTVELVAAGVDGVLVTVETMVLSVDKMLDALEAVILSVAEVPGVSAVDNGRSSVGVISVGVGVTVVEVTVVEVTGDVSVELRVIAEVMTLSGVVVELAILFSELHEWHQL